MARGGPIQGSRMPFRGPSPQHGMVVPPPPVQFPPIGGNPPGNQSQTSQGLDPRKAVVRVLDIYLPEVFPIPGSQEFQGYFQATVVGPASSAKTTLAQGLGGPGLVLPTQ